MASNDGNNPPHVLRDGVNQRIPHARAINSMGSLSALNVGALPPRAVPLSSSYLQQPMSSSTSFGGMPPVPRRSVPYGRMAGMGMGMSNYCSPYSRYPTNMYSPGFGSYGGYRMSPYGHSEGGGYNTFIQMAEESTRPAFESIESVVEVVSSISMMLESTYHAVHSSYSAILGVVDQFSRLRDHLAEMLSILALLRGLRWLCLKVLYILRLRKDNPSDEAAWSSAELLAGSSRLPPRLDKTQGSAWPFLMFVGLVVGAPWLMFKLLSKSVSKKPLDLKIFRDDNGRHHCSTAGFDFKATHRDELSLTAGEKVYLSPSSYKTSPKGWVYACNSKQETGLIPVNFLVPASKRNSNATPCRTLVPDLEQSECVSAPAQPLKANPAESVFAEPIPKAPQESKDQSANPPANWDESEM